MLEALDRFRILFGARPLFVAVSVLALIVLFERLLGRTAAPRWPHTATVILGMAGAASLAAYLSTAAWYALDPHFFDNAEPSVVAIGWLFHVGQPIYHQPHSAERYSHIYGPLAFMIHGAVLGAVGPGIVISKSLSAIAAVLGIGLTFVAARRHVPASRALTFAGIEALLLLTFKNFSYWTRPEPFQTLAVAAALVVAITGRGVGAALGVGVASGVLWNLKITGPLYSLPVLVLFERRAGWRACAAAIAVGIVIAALPFALFENVSLTNYLYWFRLSANTGLLLSTLKQNLEWAMYFCLPLLVAYFATPAPARRSLGEGGWARAAAALAAAMAALAIAAAKPGAGPYHFMPFLPVIAYLAAWRTKDFAADAQVEPLVSRAAIAFVAAGAALALAQQATFVDTMLERRTRTDVADVERFVRSHQGIIEMGYGATEASSLVRPLLVFRNGEYLIDQPAVREHQLEGVEIPRATLDALAACRVRYWLVPTGESPFVGRNVYAAVFFRPIFSEAFRDTFFATYRNSGSTRYYDVWECTGAR